MFNKFIKLIAILVISVQLSVSLLTGRCNECFANSKIACLDENHFSTCFEGSPTTTITKCPGNRVCTEDVLICRSWEEGYTPSCYHEYCGDCAISNGIFTCLDETTYGYCFGNTTPLQGTLRSCPQGFVCNYNSREVCVPEKTSQPSCVSRADTTDSTSTYTTEISTISMESTTTEMTTETTIVSTTTTDGEALTTIDSTTQTTAATEVPTTGTTITTEIPTTETTTTNINTEIPTTLPTTTTQIPTTETTTSTKTPHDATAICKEIGKQGYFKTDDPNCREYVYCYLLAGQYLGWFYYCDGYFNAETQKCQKERPLDCVAAYEY